MFKRFMLPTARDISTSIVSQLTTKQAASSEPDDRAPLHNITGYPESKLTIVGGGIIGFLEAYYAHLDAEKNNKRIRITMYEKNSLISDTTVGHLIPNITPREIIYVVPRGDKLLNALSDRFDVPGGLRVDDVRGINDLPSTRAFIDAVTNHNNETEHYLEKKEKTLLEFAMESVELWQHLYDHADEELKSILIQSNFNRCRESNEKKLHDGYRIDLVYGCADARSKAKDICDDYEKLGYRNCKLLTPDETEMIDPFLADFCRQYSILDKNGKRDWKDEAIAFWRPGGCIDTQVFLPLFCEYLQKKMGQYTNHAGKTKNCFQFRLGRNVEQVIYDSTEDNRLNGLRFFGDSHIKRNKHAYLQSDYVFCPGESVGTLKKFGFSEPAYAGIAGTSLMLCFDLPENIITKYANFSHHMSVYKSGVSSSWQARCIGGDKIFIGLAGAKSMYGDIKPDRDEKFAKEINLCQLNMMNDVLPELISLALCRSTRGVHLTETDMLELEEKKIAKRWVGLRSVAYDCFPTLGAVYNQHGRVSNARCTTHLGSGGASVAHGAVLFSRSSMYSVDSIPQDLQKEVLAYADSQRNSL